MDTSDTAAVVVAVACALAVAVLLVAIYALNRTLRELRNAIEDLRRETLPVVSEMRTAAGQANVELARVDNLLGTAEPISTTLDSPSPLPYLPSPHPLTNPIPLPPAPPP